MVFLSLSRFHCANLKTLYLAGFTAGHQVELNSSEDLPLLAV
jgi:hypothetical protein